MDNLSLAYFRQVAVHDISRGILGEQRSIDLKSHILYNSLGGAVSSGSARLRGLVADHRTLKRIREKCRGRNLPQGIRQTLFAWV